MQYGFQYILSNTAYKVLKADFSDTLVYVSYNCDELRSDKSRVSLLNRYVDIYISNMLTL